MHGNGSETRALREGDVVGDDGSRKVALIHLGCAKNLVDSEAMLGRVLGPDVALTTAPAEADVIIVNTCSFIGPARKESVDAILDAARLKEEGRCRRLVVAGCLVERYREELAREIPEVDAFVSVNDIPRIAEAALGGLEPVAAGDPEYVYDFEAPRLLSTPQGTAYLKIADGCDHACSFCAIPRIRGRMRSRSAASIVAEARDLGRRGSLEINLVSHDTTAYGQDLGMKDGLADLLQALRSVEGIAWIRVLYLYPTNLGRRVIDILGSGPPFLPYFDVPLQHAHPAMLKRMRRGVNVRQTIERIRRRVPHATLRTTFIVGYPGEGDEEFAALASFVRETRLDRVGVFPFSFEEGVPATPQGDPVPSRMKRERRRELLAIQRAIAREKNRALVGRTLPCLLLGYDEGRGRHWGRVACQAPEVDGVTYVAGHADAAIPCLRDVKVTGAGPYDLTARAV